MAEQRFGSETLAKVFQDMAVFDATGERIGTVAFVYLGSSSEDALASGTGAARAPDSASTDPSPLALLAEIFRGRDPVPETLRARLLRHGFIRINVSGLLAADRYALPEEIESVTDAGVTLRVRRDELIKQ
jgi:hypothetical protein